MEMGQGSAHKHQAEFPRSILECQICLAPPTKPVATSCGHLFCWPCLFRWIQDEPKPCPVCRTMVTIDINITPIYGSHEEGSTDAGCSDPDQGGDPDGVIPPRPNPPTRTINIRIDTGSDQIISLAATSEQIINGSLLAVNTLMEVNHRNERARRELRAALEIERARVHMLRRERRHLTAGLNYLRRRNYALIHEAGQRVRRQGEERQAFLNWVRNSARQHFARFEEQLVASQYVND
ncbi:hypothetical protein M758_8G143800 [Ceratodon purpureus]|nr:hypothetical protein M758_8G143800 [Ceratodon purpureus]